MKQVLLSTGFIYINEVEQYGEMEFYNTWYAQEFDKLKEKNGAESCVDTTYCKLSNWLTDSKWFEY